jgi:hypothetical protein
MPASHGKQKRLEKQRKKRALVRKRQQTRQAELLLATSGQVLIRRAAAFPHGPSYVSPEWRDENLVLPTLVSVVITRRAPGGQIIPAVALVDRTCLGVKDGFIGWPIPEVALDAWLEPLVERHEEMEPCDLLLAQSIVFHAIDYARTLGFEPHSDFPETVFGPRPAALLDTPLAKPARPCYVSGPDDNVTLILEKLRRNLGDEFRFMATITEEDFFEGDDFEGDDVQEDDERLE